MDKIKAAIDHLPMQKAADSKDIVGEFLRNDVSDFQRLLLYFVILVWHHERVPHNLGTGTFVSLYKAGNSTDTGSYRGMTLIYIISKLFSAMICLQSEKSVVLY